LPKKKGKEKPGGKELGAEPHASVRGGATGTTPDFADRWGEAMDSKCR